MCWDVAHPTSKVGAGKTGTGDESLLTRNRVG